MTLKRILATAIVWTGGAVVGALFILIGWVLVSAFIADWPQSLYALLSIPAMIAIAILLAVVGHWAWNNKWKP